MPAASRSTVFNASPEEAFAVISDYEKYPLFLPEVKGVRVLAREGSQADVRFEIEVVKRLWYTLQMKHTPPFSIFWSFVEGEIIRDNSGSWRLQALPGGKTEATYSVEIGLGPFIPKAIVNGLVEHSLPRMLDAFSHRIGALR